MDNHRNIEWDLLGGSALGDLADAISENILYKKLKWNIVFIGNPILVLVGFFVWTFFEVNPETLKLIFSLIPAAIFTFSTGLVAQREQVRREVKYYIRDHSYTWDSLPLEIKSHIEKLSSIPNGGKLAGELFACAILSLFTTIPGLIVIVFIVNILRVQ